jgi:hypothetical protein
MKIRCVKAIVAIAYLFELLVTPTIARADPVEPTLSVKSVSPAQVGLGDTLVVEIDQLKQWYDWKQTDAGKTDRSTRDLDKAILYLNGHPIPETPKVDVSNNLLRFVLERTDSNKSDWATVLGRPDAFTRKVSVTVGFPGGSMLSPNLSVDFTIIRSTASFWILLGLYVLVVVGFVRLVRSSSILRDSSPDPNGRQMTPYSLGRTQMAFWFFIVLSLYLLIWIVTGDRDTLSDSALALIGISSATALGAVVVDSSKTLGTTNQLQSLRQETSRLDSRVAQLKPMMLSGIAQDLQREYADSSTKAVQIDARIKELETTLRAVGSEGFLVDILTDSTGVSLHRFQLMVWTLVLGFIFIFAAYNDLAMPTLGGPLLALMGISNGTYIGFKFPEQQA